MRRITQKQVLAYQFINIDAPVFEKEGVIQCVICVPCPNIGCFDLKLITRKMVEKNIKKYVCDLCNKEISTIGSILARRSRKVKSVICTSPDRISRKATDCLAIRVLLKKHGADLIFTDNKILDEEPNSGIFDEILKTIKAYDQIISGRIRLGKKGK